MDGHAVAVEELGVVGEMEHLGPEEVVLLLLAGRELGVVWLPAWLLTASRGTGPSRR